jgi:dynein light chain LC8-type
MKLEMPSAQPTQTLPGSTTQQQNPANITKPPSLKPPQQSNLPPQQVNQEQQQQQQKVPVPATVQIRTVFMDEAKQAKAIDLAREACANEKMSQSPREIAGHIKNHFDALYGPAWHCIVGRSYGSFVTHGTHHCFLLDTN